MNPIFESSARRRMRLRRTPVIITAYLGTLLIVALSLMTPFFGKGVGVGEMRLGIECYIWMTALQFWLIVLVAPVLSAGSIAGERERQTFDLLLVTGIGPRRIVMGKLMESFAFLALLIACSAPVMAIALVTGGVTALDVTLTLVYLMAIAWAALSAGMLMSVIFRRTLGAVVAAYLLILALGLGSWALAKHGPLAAEYSNDSLSILTQMPPWTAIRSIPVTLFLNPAVGLVLLLAGQTGILHRTIESTLRLYDIYYVVSKAAGFTRVAWVSLASILAAAALLILLSVAILWGRTGGRRARISRR